MDPAILELAAELGASRKYARVCEDTRLWVAEWAWARARNARDADKRARTKLHQICGAFLDGRDIEAALRALETTPPPPDRVGWRAVVEPILRRHASTAERLGEIERFHAEVLTRTGPCPRVLDLACGLHPLTVPWMDASSGIDYRAFDIDTATTDLANVFLRRAGVRGGAEPRDVLRRPPMEIEADLAFLLKALPTFEQQEAGAGWKLLKSLRCRWAVVSYPVRSLGGREKGMRDHYAASFREGAAAYGLSAEELPLQSELAWLVALR